MNKLVIIGAGGHGKVAADIAVRNGYRDIVFLDDYPETETCLGFPVTGTTELIDSYPDADFFVAVGNPDVREIFFKKLNGTKKRIVTLIHPDAVIESHVTIGRGTVVMAGAVINPDSKIGEGCIINTCSSVDHDNRIADFVHVSVGAHLAGSVSVAERTWIGIGAAVSNNLTICEDCMIGAGAVVVKDIIIPGTYIGVPAERKAF